MASITACTPTSSVPGTRLFFKSPASLFSAPILGLPAIATKGRVRCSVEGKPSGKETEPKLGMGVSLMAAACAATMSSPAAMALVDERLSGEGTGLPFGLSNNLLGWTLLGVFGFIWTFYFLYASSLDEDEKSGLSL